MPYFGTMYVYKPHLYFVYIVTSPNKKVLYTGITNNLEQRLVEHYLNRGNRKTFAGRYSCYILVYYEEFKYVIEAIVREKVLKGWKRTRKEELIITKNPTWNSLNERICVTWPPRILFNRKDN
jgi:putative endonuclease